MPSALRFLPLVGVDGVVLSVAVVVLALAPVRFLAGVLLAEGRGPPEVLMPCDFRRRS